MNTAQHLSAAAKNVLDLRDKADGNGTSVAAKDMITGVYNSLVDLIEPDEELFIVDIDARLDLISDAIENMSYLHPATCADLSSVLHPAITHVNFVLAYGPEHDQ